MGEYAFTSVFATAFLHHAFHDKRIDAHEVVIDYRQTVIARLPIKPFSPFDFDIAC